MRTEFSQQCDKAFMELPREVKRWLNEKTYRVKTSNNITIAKIILSDYREHIEDSKTSILSFSGGKDSTALLLMMLERGMKLDYILFCDTGAEFPEMYQHIDKVDKYIQEHYGKHVTRIGNDVKLFDMLLHEKRPTGVWKGMVGYGWPSFKVRWCTKHLKTIPIRKFMESHGFTKANTKSYIGIAADEPNRIHDDVYPLFEWGVTEKDALEYCYRKGFDWGGLYEHVDRLSCWMCPLESNKSIRNLYFHHRDLWEKLKKMDDEVIANGHKYRYRMFHPSDKTLREWEEYFKKEEDFKARQGSLF